MARSFILCFQSWWADVTRRDDRRRPEWAEAMEIRLQHFIKEELEDVQEEFETEIDEAVEKIIAAIHPARPTTGMRLTIRGVGMADTTLSVDTTGEKAVAQWTDDKGDITPTPPNGPDGNPGSFKYGSSDESVATVDAATGDLTFLKAGNVSITVDAVDSTGTVLTGFSQQSAGLVLTPGTATSFEVSVEGAPPVPVQGKHSKKK